MAFDPTTASLDWVAPVAGVIGAGFGAALAGLFKVWRASIDRRNKWLEFERGNARKFMQHVAVHCRGEEVDETDERLIGHYYTLALALSDDEAAASVYADLPPRLRNLVHDPGAPPFSHLRVEVTPGRRRKRSVPLAASDNPQV
jgi:hypothetical protein